MAGGGHGISVGKISVFLRFMMGIMLLCCKSNNKPSHLQGIQWLHTYIYICVCVCNGIYTWDIMAIYDGHAGI